MKPIQNSPRLEIVNSIIISLISLSNNVIEMNEKKKKEKIENEYLICIYLRGGIMNCFK